jgi:hypothetical protein
VRAAHGDIMAITMTRFRWALLLNSLMVATATGESRLVDFYTGSQLHSFCQGENVPTCIGYILGVTSSRSPAGTFCIPQGGDGKHVVDTVKLWLNNHPEKRQAAANLLVLQALNEAFPCR